MKFLNEEDEALLLTGSGNSFFICHRIQLIDIE